MFDITKNKIITVNRGDSFEFNVDINIGTPMNEVPHTMLDAERLYFALMEPNKSFEQAILVKWYDKTAQNEDGTVTIKFDPSDTENLHEGVYYYQIKLRAIVNNELGEDEVSTIIGKTKFIILD